MVKLYFLIQKKSFYSAQNAKAEGFYGTYIEAFNKLATLDNPHNYSIIEAEKGSLSFDPVINSKAFLFIQTDGVVTCSKYEHIVPTTKLNQIHKTNSNYYQVFIGSESNSYYEQLRKAEDIFNSIDENVKTPNKYFFVCLFDIINEYENIQSPIAMFDNIEEAHNYLVRHREYADCSIRDLEVYSNINRFDNSFLVLYHYQHPYDIEYIPSGIFENLESALEQALKYSPNFTVKNLNTIDYSVDYNKPVLCKKGYSYRFDFDQNKYWCSDDLEYLDINKFDVLNHHVGNIWDIYLAEDTQNLREVLQKILEEKKFNP
jgi:hypothetical protein